MSRHKYKEVVLEMLSRKGHDKIPTKTLARKLLGENPGLFRDIEHARKRVMYYRGENGVFSRASIASESIVKTDKSDMPWKYLPEPEEQPVETTPYQIDLEGHGTILSDVHIPYHDVRAMEAALEHAHKTGATDFLYINGDLMDCPTISRHEKAPFLRHIIGDIKDANEVLDIFGEMFKKVYYKFGNHESNMRRYIWRNAPELVGMHGLELHEQLRLEKRGFHVVGESQTAFIGEHLTIAHGHEFFGGGINPARTAFRKMKVNSLVGHFHRTSNHTERTARMDTISTYSTGCLCHLRPSWYPQNDWNHGFATMHVQGSDFEIDNKRIINNKVR